VKGFRHTGGRAVGERLIRAANAVVLELFGHVNVDDVVVTRGDDSILNGLLRAAVASLNAVMLGLLGSDSKRYG
jgi:hypothetical protein